MKHNFLKIKKILLSLLTLNSTTLAMTLPQEATSSSSMVQTTSGTGSFLSAIDSKALSHDSFRKTSLRDIIDVQINKFGSKDKIHPYLSLINDLYFSKKNGPTTLHRFVVSIMNQAAIVETAQPHVTLQLDLFTMFEEVIKVLNYYTEHYPTHILPPTFYQSGLTDSEYRMACDFWNLDLYSHLFLANNEEDVCVPVTGLDQVLQLSIKDAAHTKIDGIYNDAKYILWANVIFPNIPIGIREDFLRMLKNNCEMSPQFIADSIFYKNIEFVSHLYIPSLQSISFKINVAIQDSINHAISEVSGLSKADQADLFKKATHHLQPLVKYWFENKILNTYGATVGVKINPNAHVMGFSDPDIHNTSQLKDIAAFCQRSVEWVPFKVNKHKKRNDVINPSGTSEVMNKVAFHYLPNQERITASSFLTLCYYAAASFRDLHNLIRAKINQSVVLHTMQMRVMDLLPEPTIDDEQTILAFNSSPIDVTPSQKKPQPKKGKKKSKKAKGQSASFVAASPVKTTFDTTAFQALSKLNPGMVSETTLEAFNAPVVDVPSVIPSIVADRVMSPLAIQEQALVQLADDKTVDSRTTQEDVQTVSKDQQKKSDGVKTKLKSSQMDAVKEDTALNPFSDTVAELSIPQSAPQFPKRRESKEELSELTVSTDNATVSVLEQVGPYESDPEQTEYTEQEAVFFPLPVVYIGVPYMIMPDNVKRPYFLPVLPHEKASTCLKNMTGIRVDHSWVLQDKIDTKLYVDSYNPKANDYEVSQCEYCGMIAQSLTKEAAERLNA